jgi:hypothetical protein
MKTHFKELFLLPALIAGLGLIPAGRVTAQTFTTLLSFTAPSGSNHTNSDGAQPRAGLILTGHTLYGTAYLMAAIRRKARCLPSTPMARVLRSCIVSLSETDVPRVPH